MRIKKALISVSDKTGLEEFVKGLDELGVEIISTGGTAKLISSLDIDVTEVSSYTGFPEMLDGRVKTLHPKIHAGLLALRENPDHEKQMKEKNIPYIDMVVVNLYPFEKTVAKESVSEEEAIENIDIGGPSMLRSASKNFKYVAVVSSPDQYESVLTELKSSGGSLSEGTRRNLATRVFYETSRYDKAIWKYLSGKKVLEMDLEKVMDLRYGENPHQNGAFYRDLSSDFSGLADAVKLQGKELSFNNIMDLDAAMRIAMAFEKPSASIVKHGNPCGAAVAGDSGSAFLEALECDRLSAFGGIIALNLPVSKKTAEILLKESDFIECVIAPGYEKGALEVLSAKKNIRVMELPFNKGELTGEKDVKKVLGGMLVQDMDLAVTGRGDLKVVTKVKPREEVIDSLLFAWEIVKHVKSNAIVLCSGTKTVGIGAGQMSRVDSVKIAVNKAGQKAKGSVLASDAFFPMSDNIEEAHKAGVSAIIQPGGSIRDDEVIAACDKYGIAMVFTGTRHFRH